MADRCSIKFWLPRDLYGSVLSLAYRKRTSMSKVLRTLCKAVQDVNRECYIQEELEKQINPPRELSKEEWEKWRKDFKKSRPGLDNLFQQAKENLKQELKPQQEEKKMEGMKAVKFFLANDVFEFIKMAALLQKKSMSELFREYARSVAEDTKKLARERFKDMGQNLTKAPEKPVDTVKAASSLDDWG